jgi:hypothetical protein
MKVLLDLFQFVFGCRHRHLSRVFTIKHRTYKVCFDCGREFDLPAAHAPMRSDRSPGTPPGDESSSRALSFALRCTPGIPTLILPM